MERRIGGEIPGAAVDPGASTETPQCPKHLPSPWGVALKWRAQHPELPRDPGKLLHTPGREPSWKPIGNSMLNILLCAYTVFIDTIRHMGTTCIKSRCIKRLVLL